MNFSQNNDLGGREYTDAEQQLLHQLALKLKERGPAHNMGTASPRDYMDLYVRAAGAIYETARALSAMNVRRKEIHNYNVDGWIRILTGLGMLEEVKNDTLGLDHSTSRGGLPGDTKPRLSDPSDRNNS